MLVLVTYDVKTGSEGGQRRLRQVAKACQDYGQRVQYSVFEISIDPAQWEALRSRLESVIDPKVDSLRYYYLGKNWHRKITHVGAKPARDLEAPLIF